MKSLYVCLVTGITLVTLAGCASKPTTADLMRAQATEIQAKADLQAQLAKDWERGTNLVETGENHVKKGEKLINSAQEDLKKGEQLVEKGNKEIAEGQKLILESERQFNDNFTTQPVSSSK